MQEHQYTSVQPQSLSRTAASVTLSNAITHLSLVAHIGAIRVVTSSSLALQTARRIEEWTKSIISALFPALQIDLLLPCDSENLVYLDQLQKIARHGQSLNLQGNLVDPEERFSAFFVRPGLRGEYHAMISYRQHANKKFARRLYDNLSGLSLPNQQPLRVFLDESDLLPGCQFVNDFCLALSRSLVALPVMSVQAIMTMKTLLDKGEPDNVLLEWSLMLALHDADRLHRIYPILVGDSWCDQQAPISVSDFDALKTFVNSAALDAVNEKTYELLCRFVTKKLQLATPRKRSVKEIVLDLLKFIVLCCFQKDSQQQDINFDAFEEYAHSIRDVIINAKQLERDKSRSLLKVCEFEVLHMCACVLVSACRADL